MSKGDGSWQNLVPGATLRVIALPKAMVNVICVVAQGLILAWRCWLGMRVTAKDAAEQGYALFVMERAKSVELLFYKGRFNRSGRL